MDNNFNSVFFGENGLTSTSAQHVKDMAGHYVDDLKQKLSSITFVNSNINIIGGENSTLVNKGWNEEELNSVNEILERISQAQALQAWLGEAINAKQNRQTYVGHYNIKDYCNDYNIVYPTEPTNVKYATEADWLKTLSIKELNRYLTLQTYCAVFGNFIHPKYGSNFHTARQLAIKVEKAPYEVTENGRDTVIYNKTLSVDIETIDNKYFELQAIHRDKQSEFNALRHQFEVYRDSKFTQDQTEYDKKLLEYKQRVTELSSQWQAKKDELERECANLKIVIPDALKSIYDKVNRLGK